MATASTDLAIPQADKAELTREIIRVDQLIASPESRGKRTILKSYQRKLYSQLMRATREQASA